MLKNPQQNLNHVNKLLSITKQKEVVLYQCESV
nr:MAG TPA: hypothetical protein [Caudoviricetes sp.]